MFYPYDELRSVMSNDYDSSDDESDDYKAKLVRRKHAEEKAKQGQKFLEQPQAFKIRTRYLNQSAYQVWWRPGIVNKMLWAACETGDNYEIDFLVKFAHADINAVDFNMKHLTALMRSVMNGRKETVKLLIGHGVNVNATDSHGSTALHYAAIFGWPRIVEMLLEAKIDRWKQNQDNKTALDSALEFVVPYDADRTPEEDDFIDPRRVLRLKGNQVVIAGSNWETVGVLRAAMGLPPADMLHLTGDIENFDWLEEKVETYTSHLRAHPQTVVDMPPVLPDGSAWHEGLILDNLPRKRSSPFWKPYEVQEAVWPAGFPAANKRAGEFGFPIPELPELNKKDFDRWNTPWRFPVTYGDGSRGEQGREHWQGEEGSGVQGRRANAFVEQESSAPSPPRAPPPPKAPPPPRAPPPR